MDTRPLFLILSIAKIKIDGTSPSILVSNIYLAIKYSRYN